MGSKTQTQVSKKFKILSGILKRKRGRPEGKNRVPLSKDERRARNAHYERERRREVADSLADLAEAVGCNVSDANADLLARALQCIQAATTREPSQDINNLRRINETITRQIEILEQQLTNAGIYYEDGA